MKLQRRNFLLLLTLATAAAPVSGLPAWGQAPEGHGKSAEAAPGLGGIWIHGSIPGFAAPALRSHFAGQPVAAQWSEQHPRVGRRLYQSDPEA